MARVKRITAPGPTPARAPRTSSADKPPHPADARRAAVLADPASYTASIRANGRNNTLPAPDLASAALAATWLEVAARSAYGATTYATVYALPRDGGGAETVARAAWCALVTPAQLATIVSSVRSNLKA